MTFHFLRTTFATAVLCTVAGIGALGQQGRGSAPPPAADWPLHNLDLHNTRYSPLEPDQHVQREPAGRQLVVSGAGRGQHRVDDAARRQRRDVFQLRVAAVRARRGDRQDSLDVPGRSAVSRRRAGVRRTATAASTRSAVPIVYAVDAKTGKLVESFGKGGLLPHRQRGARSSSTRASTRRISIPTTLGYSMTTPPTYVERHALRRHAVLRQPAAGRPGGRGGRQRPARSSGCSTPSRRAPQDDGVGDREGHLERRPRTAAASGRSPRSIPSSDCSTSTRGTRRRTTTARRGRA